MLEFISEEKIIKFILFIYFINIFQANILEKI